MRLRRLAPGLAAGGVLLLAGWLAAEGWQRRSSLERARREVERGQYGAARERLAGLATRWPRQAEVAYLLGLCEQAAGRPEAALAAWSRLPPGPPFAVRAAVPRAGALLAARGAFA